MVTNKKVYGKALSMPAGICLGTTVSLLVMLIGCMMIAILIDMEVLNLASIGYGGMGILFLSSFVGAIVAAIMIKRQKLMVCIIQCGCFYGLLFLINGLLFGGTVTGAVPTAILLLGGAMCGALLQTTGNRGGKVKIKKVRTG